MRGAIRALVALALCLFTLGFGESPRGAKSSLAPRGTKSILMTNNDHICVQLDDATGRFVVKTFPDTLWLMYAAGGPWSSHVIVRVDDQSYKCPGGGPICPQMEISTPFSVRTWPTNPDSNYIYGGWYIPEHPDVLVYQWLQPVYLEYPDYTTGTVFIKYVVVNTGSSCHDIGVLLELDTMINDNDAARIGTISGVIGNESDFWYSDGDLPCYWFAYEDPLGPGGPPDQLVALGIMCGLDAVHPDRFAVGNWSNFYTVSWYASITGDPYTDSAVLLWWYPEEICPGESLVVATYYGLGEPLSGNLVVHIPVYPSVENCWYSPDTFEVDALFTNGSPTTMTNPIATIELPSGLSLVGGYTPTQPLSPSTLMTGETGSTGWWVRIYGAPEYGDSICVTVTAPSCEDTFRTCREFWLPEIHEPTAEIAFPVDGAVSLCPRQEIAFLLDAPNGVEDALVVVDGDTFDLSSPQLGLVGDTLIFSPSEDWASGEVHTFELLRLVDSLGCETSVGAASFTSDLAPPVVTSPYPADGALVGTTDLDSISVILYDAERAVDPASVTFTLGDDTFAVDGHTLALSGSLLVFRADSAGIAFHDGDTICCALLDAADIEGDYCEPNHIAEPFRWCFSINIVDIWIPDTLWGHAGDVVDIPVCVEDITGFGITQMDVVVGYFPSVLLPLELVTAGTITESWGLLSMSVPEPGRVRIAGSGPPLSGRGVLFYIRCLVEDVMGAYSLLPFEDIEFNFGGISANPDDGFFTVPWDPVQWSGTIFFITKNMPVEHITFGASDSATAGFDEGIDLESPDVVPGELDGWFDISDSEHPEITRLDRDIRSSAETLLVWSGHCAYGSPTETVYVHWSPAHLPDGLITLTYTSPVGDVTLNMKVDTAFAFIGTTDFEITFLRTTPQRRTVDICPGWNMLSLPVLPAGDPLIRDIVPGAITDGYWYNPEAGYYEVVESPEAGRAFWVFTLESGTFDVAGMDATLTTIRLHPGWNMVGVPASAEGFVLVDDLSTVPAGAVLADNILFYDACGTGTYVLAGDTLFVGRGYWVLATEECQLILRGGEGKLVCAAPAESFDILVGDARLVLALDPRAKSGIDWLDIPLPPPPPGADPQPAFRCEGARLLRETKPHGTFVIDAPRGCTISWDPQALPEEFDFVLADGARTCDMRRSSSWTVEAGVSITATPAPRAPALEAPTPNPFNGATQIGFTLPEAQYVRIDVFDITGARVKTLWRGDAPAGRHTILWRGDGDNAKPLPSGVYIIRLSAPGASRTTRVILLR